MAGLEGAIVIAIPREDTRSYNRALDSWLPEGVREAAADRSDISPRRMKAKRVIVAYNRFRAWRKDEDWETFLRAVEEYRK